MWIYVLNLLQLPHIHTYIYINACIVVDASRLQIFSLASSPFSPFAALSVQHFARSFVSDFVVFVAVLKFTLCWLNRAIFSHK